MKCEISRGKKLAFTFVLFSLCFFSALGQRDTAYKRMFSISEEEFNYLLGNTKKLLVLNSELELKLQDLTLISSQQTKQLESLELERQNLQSQLSTLSQSLESLESQLGSSLAHSTELQAQLAKAESSYKTVYESYMELQKEMESLLKKERVNKIIAQGLAWAGGIAAIVGWILYGWERLVIR